VTQAVKRGENVIAVRGKNDSSWAGFIGKLDLTLAGAKQQTVSLTRRGFPGAKNRLDGKSRVRRRTAGPGPSASETRAEALGNVMAGAVCPGFRPRVKTGHSG